MLYSEVDDIKKILLCLVCIKNNIYLSTKVQNISHITPIASFGIRFNMCYNIRAHEFKISNCNGKVLVRMELLIYYMLLPFILLFKVAVFFFLYSTDYIDWETTKLINFNLLEPVNGQFGRFTKQINLIK